MVAQPHAAIILHPCLGASIGVFETPLEFSPFTPRKFFPEIEHSIFQPFIPIPKIFNPVSSLTV
jgi:hypothetical protein